MATLPARPDLGHLRRQARDLLRAARSRDSAAAARIASVSTTLAAAQLAVAREYGFASWARLKTTVDARTRELAELADAFCEASIRSGTSQAARMLASTGTSRCLRTTPSRPASPWRSTCAGSASVTAVRRVGRPGVP